MLIDAFVPMPMMTCVPPPSPPPFFFWGGLIPGPRRGRVRNGAQRDNVHSFVMRHPSHRLVEVCIGDAGAAALMAGTFGVAESCWEHRNHNGGPGTNSAKLKLKLPGVCEVARNTV